jgi:hypothetical protein
MTKIRNVSTDYCMAIAFGEPYITRNIYVCGNYFPHKNAI